MRVSLLAMLALVLPNAALAADRVAPAKGPVLAPYLLGADAPMPMRLQVSFTASARARAGAHGIDLSDAVNRVALDAVVAAHGLRFAPLHEHPMQVESLRARAQARSHRAQPDLLGSLRVFPADGTVEGLEAAGNALQALVLVEFAQIVHLRVPPPGDIDPETPDFSAQQTYCDSNPGISARAVHSRGYTGSNIRVSDVEYGWLETHEEFEDIDLGLEEGMTIPSWVYDNGWEQHGTATVGEIAAPNNGYGVTGCAYEVSVGTYPEYIEYSRRAAAITSAASDSLPGDVILLEMQTTGAGGGYGPAELDYTVWQATSVAVDAGVVVVGAAGNGSQNLDSADYSSYMAWGDSGAILVGAGGSNTSHSKLGFSTYGSRVNLQGWGQNVFTLGYGDYASYGSDKRQHYTSRFSGTSSASPIVTSAVALLQDAAVQVIGEPLEPLDLRQILIDTGVAQGGSGHIGPLPNVEAAIDFMIEAYGVDPHILEVTAPASAVEGESVELSVTYTVDDGLTGTVTWDFADGSQSTGDTVTKTWVDDLLANVVVTLTDDAFRTDEQTVQVLVANVAPSVELPELTPTWVEGTPRTISSTVSDPGLDDELHYVWDLGNETQEGVDLEQVQGVWPEGEWTVSLTVDDGDGGSASDTVSFTVVNGAPVIESLDVEGGDLDQELVLSVQATDPGGDAMTYAWDFGDGSTGEGDTVTHTWQTKGTFDVTVTVTDADGASTSDGRPVAIRSGCGCAAVGVAPTGFSALWMGLVLLWRRRR